MARDAKSIADYWSKLAKERGVPDDRAAAILEALKDETFGKTFGEAFVPQPDYSRDLDKMRDEWKGKAEAAGTKLSEYDKWYQDAKATYDSTLTKATEMEGRLKKYETAFGAIEPDGTATPPTLPPGVITQKDLEAWESKRRANDAELVDVAFIVADHMHRFKEPLPRKELAEFMKTNQLGSVSEAYDKWIAPKVEAQQAAQIEERVKREREEAVRDYASKHALPLEEKPREFSTFFDRQEKQDGWSDRAERKQAYDAVVSALREPAPGNKTS